MQGTSKGDLPLKSLPLKARLAHKMNVSQPLLSLGQLANEGLVSILDKHKIIVCKEDAVTITLKEQPVLQGRRAVTGLWKIPLPTASATNPPIESSAGHCANSAYTQRNNEDLAIYLHACAGFPVTETW